MSAHMAPRSTCREAPLPFSEVRRSLSKNEAVVPDPEELAPEKIRRRPSGPLARTDATSSPAAGLEPTHLDGVVERVSEGAAS